MANESRVVSNDSELKQDLKKIYKDLDEIIKAMNALQLNPGYNNLKTFCNIMEAINRVRSLAERKANTTVYEVGSREGCD